MSKTAAPKRGAPVKGRAQQTRVTTTHQAAEAFVRNLTRQVWGDLLDLVEPKEQDPTERARDYANLKEAVRRQHQLPVHDLDQLRGDVLASVRDGLSESAREALDTYIDASGDEAIVRENAAYILGMAIGRAFGKRARLRKPF